MSTWTDLLPAAVRLLDVAGTRTRVLELGPDDGVPLLLLHGRGGHLETFVRNVRDLADAGSRVNAFDLLGHGLTQQTGRTYDVGELLSHARAVRDLLAPGVHDVVGQSLGGWIAVLLAQERAPRRLTLIEPAGFQSEEDRMADPVVREAAAEGGRAFDDSTEENVRRRFAQLVLDPAVVEDEMVALRTRLYAIPGAGGVHRAVRTANNHPWALEPASLPGDSMPLILRGEQGHIPRDLLAAAAALAGGRVEDIPGARQWPHYENPTVVNDLIRHHLKEKAA